MLSPWNGLLGYVEGCADFEVVVEVSVVVVSVVVVVVSVVVVVVVVVVVWGGDCVWGGWWWRDVGTMVCRTSLVGV